MFRSSTGQALRPRAAARRTASCAARIRARRRHFDLQTGHAWCQDGQPGKVLIGQFAAHGDGLEARLSAGIPTRGTTLAAYLPGPIVAREDAGRGEDGGRYRLVEPEQSIGRVSSFFGNFGMLVRAYAYLRMHGAEGLRQNALHAVLNANYLRVALRQTYPVPFDRINMHEFVCQGRIEGSPVHALDISKRLMDYGFHPPTNYFPLIVPEALMIEPTETESRETLDAFVDALRQIAREAIEDPDLLASAPHDTPVGRLDEVRAARQRVLCQPPLSQPTHEPEA